MPVTRWSVPLVLSAFVLNTPHAGAGPAPLQPPESKPRASVEVEVKYIDDSTMKLRLLDDKLEVSTRYGVLHVPAADVRKIEFANRVPGDVAEKVSAAIGRLNHPDYKVRETATAELKAHRERAYPLTLKALKHDDPEVSRRADEIVKHIQAKAPAGLLECRECDVIHTDDCKITGRLTAEVLRVSTFQFGDQPLKLADLRTLRSGPAAVAEEVAAAAQAPGNMSAYQQQYGKEMAFAVTAFVPTPGANPNVWGTDHYTLDSNLAAAVVHAGLAKAGETVVVRVRVVQSPPQFVSSFRNGVNSTAYGNYPAGAYEFVRR